jgi:hypothetical protein
MWDPTILYQSDLGLVRALPEVSRTRYTRITAASTDLGGAFLGGERGAHRLVHAPFLLDRWLVHRGDAELWVEGLA